MERKQIVQRHHPEFDRLNPLSPLSVGNGEFAFTADLTGLQTFPEQYEVPLGTQSNWGWHFTGDAADSIGRMPRYNRLTHMAARSVTR